MFPIRTFYKFSIFIDKQFGTGFTKAPPSLLDLKIGYCYVIEVADSKSDLGLHGTTLISKILLFFSNKSNKNDIYK